MATNVLNAELLAKMFLAGAKNLESKKEYINELNVFPVPDGDTGTNMTLTIMSAAKELNNLNDKSMQTVCKAISSGSLRGARGNSGVILSQLIRGFTKVASEADEITIPVLAAACDKAVQTAYKAVMKPKEGTILTVAAGAATKAKELADNGCDNMEEFIDEVIKHADYVLSTTPDLLPVLKQAGVVDSGGQGLMEVLKGAFDAYQGKVTDFSLKVSGGSAKKSAAAGMENLATSDIKFGYCTEFIILLSKTFNVKHEMDFKDYLESIGDSIVVVADDEIVKVHVHTNDPGLAIQRALKYGQLSNLKIDNMRLEHNEMVIKSEEGEEAPKADEPRKEYGFIAVSVGKGINEIFKSLGVDYIIEGGQTMNPSTEDMLNAIDKVNADNIFILPNNKNIVMAANQARDLTQDKKIIVIPTKTIPQGITAVINFMADIAPDENEEQMGSEMGNVKTGQVTYAVRDTEIDDKKIAQGDYMGIGDKGILSVGKEMKDVTLEMIAEMVDEDSDELISIYYGEDISEEDATALSEEIEAKYPDLDVELQYGGQPIYYYIVSVE
ncbi:MAG: DAK2 domain-containing protein [Lachnospiraceae bacterium]|nr:DAK2 domain-containing protein [Lachnospiraceae bacterium]